jgi:hypothetical protein
MNARTPGVGPIRIAVAVVCFALSLFALRTAVRRMIAALAAWLAGGALFMAGLLFFVAGSWRLIRARLARRRQRPAA